MSALSSVEEIEPISTLDNEMPYTDPISSSAIVEEPPKYQSLFSLTVNLINSVLGASVLSVGNSFIFCGYYPSLFFLTICCIFSYFSCCLLAKLQLMTQCDSYPQITAQAFGSIGSALLSVCVPFFCYSSMTAYLQIGADSIRSLLELVNWRLPGETNRRLIVLVFSLILVPTTIPKQIGVLSIISTFAAVALAIFFFMTILEGALFLPKHGINKTVENLQFNIHIFNAIGIFCSTFALTVIQLPLLIRAPPDLRFRNRALGATFLVSYMIVLIPGVIGYAIFGTETNEILYQSFPVNSVPMIIVRFAYCVILIASYPILGLSVLTTWGGVLFKVHDAKKLTWKQRGICLFLENTPCILFAILIPKVRPILGIGGGFAGSMTSYFFPSAIFLKLTGSKWYLPKNWIYSFLVVFGIVSTCCATGVAVLDAIQAFKYFK